MTATVPAPGPHGGDGLSVARALGMDPADVLDLSASLNPLAPDLGAFLRRHSATVRRYPDPATATAALADRLGVDTGRVVLTNGGSEAIHLVGAMLEGGRVEEPEFSLLPREGGPRWRSNPNNPLGNLAPPDATADVWDEAFWPLATGTWTRGDLAGGAWVVGSLTKLFACPGLRIGYVVAPDDRAATEVSARQPEWPVNGLALALVEHLVPATPLREWAAGVAVLRRALVGVLEDVGLAVRDTDACWVLVDEPGLRERLAPRGIVVRDCTSFGLAGTHRLAVPGEAGLARLREALA